MLKGVFAWAAEVASRLCRYIFNLAQDYFKKLYLSPADEAAAMIAAEDY